MSKKPKTQLRDLSVRARHLAHPTDKTANMITDTPPSIHIPSIGSPSIGSPSIGTQSVNSTSANYRGHGARSKGGS